MGHGSLAMVNYPRATHFLNQKKVSLKAGVLHTVYSYNETTFMGENGDKLSEFRYHRPRNWDAHPRSALRSLLQAVKEDWIEVSINGGTLKSSKFS